MSPRELTREFEAIRLQRRDAHDRDVVHAWHVVAFDTEVKARGRLPKIERYLSRGDDHPRAQTADQLRAALAVLSAQYGIPVKWGQA